jgi:hypothetical protein
MSAPLGASAPDENHTSDGRCKYPKTCEAEGRHAAVPGVPVEATEVPFEVRREVVRALWDHAHPERDGWTPPFDIGRTGPREWKFADEVLAAALPLLREQIAAEMLAPVRDVLDARSFGVAVPGARERDPNHNGAHDVVLVADVRAALSAPAQAAEAACGCLHPLVAGCDHDEAAQAAELVCKCAMVRPPTPWEPGEWEQVDDCPVHPMPAAEGGERGGS